MLKYTFLLFIALCFTSNIFSQDKTKDEVLQLIAEDTCECIKNDETSFTSDKTLNQKEIALGLCLMKSFNERKAESKELADTGMDQFEAIGEEVGLKMVGTCGVEFMAIFTNDQLAEFVNDEVTPAPPAVKNENDLQLEAQLVALNNDVISYFEVNDDFDKSHVFLINEQFEGYQLLKKSNFKKSFKIYYKEIDLFDLSVRKYVKKNVVKYLELL
ncbi:hypothetical protein [Thalassobellus sediminis]|uniref:hypothetical protein n=1 Tax=Thalassobellus sediminis TaxID=3367753 RepID=UPI0037A67893